MEGNDVILAGLEEMGSAERLVTTSFGQCLFRVEVLGYVLTYVFPTIASASESLAAFVTWNLNTSLNVQYSRGGQSAQPVDLC